MRKLLYLSGLLFTSWTVSCVAQTGFYLPTAPTSYGQDEFRSADGTTCRSSMDGTKRIEVGTYASGARTPLSNGYLYPAYYEAPTQGNAGVYGRFTMSLDASPDRIDCKRLFDLEMEKKRLELEVMKRSLNVADEQLDALRAERRNRRKTGESGDKSDASETRTARPRKPAETNGNLAENRSGRSGEEKRRRYAPL